MKYHILLGPNATVLSERVQAYIEKGFVPFGTPYIDKDQFHYQAVIFEPEE